MRPLIALVALFALTASAVIGTASAQDAPPDAPPAPPQEGDGPDAPPAGDPVPYVSDVPTVTLTAEQENLRRILTRMEAQVGLPLGSEQAPDMQNVDVTLRGAPLLEALDRVAEAAGVAWQPAIGGAFAPVQAGPLVKWGGNPVELGPRTYLWNYRLDVRWLETRRRTAWTGGGREGAWGLTQVGLAHTPGLDPEQVVRFEVFEVVADDGTILYDIVEDGPQEELQEQSSQTLRAAGGAIIRVARLLNTRSSGIGPMQVDAMFDHPGEAQTLARISGRLIVRHVAALETMAISDPINAIGREAQAAGVTVTVGEMEQKGGFWTLTLKVNGSPDAERHGEDTDEPAVWEPSAENVRLLTADGVPLEPVGSNTARAVVQLGPGGRPQGERDVTLRFRAGQDDPAVLEMDVVAEYGYDAMDWTIEDIPLPR